MKRESTIVVHGGAGTIDTDRLSVCVAGCEQAIAAGMEAMPDGALTAVVWAIKSLEENPVFNAGRGATLTRDRTVELDAAVMTGDLEFGAIAACPPVASAIELAREVHSDPGVNMLVGAGAAAFADEKGIRRLPPDELIEERVLRQWESKRATLEPGTVGAVAVDSEGFLAAATSTGGRLFKRSGRVGDSPLIGAGTYADAEAGGAASATGEGESILRVLMCRQAVELLKTGLSADRAGSEALQLMQRRVGGKAGLILVSADGDFSATKNTDHMPWAAGRSGSVIDSGF
jgi:L-asparaginase / beta-aspartyl-peptidase